MVQQRKKITETFNRKSAKGRRLGRELLAELKKPKESIAKKKIRQLINDGAYLDFRDDSRVTPIMEAVVKKDPALVKMLLDAGANPNVRNIASNTPLIMATFEATGEVAKLLMQHGAKLQWRDRDRMTALEWARTLGTEHVAQIIQARYEEIGELEEKDKKAAWARAYRERKKAEKVAQEKDNARRDKTYRQTPAYTIVKKKFDI